PDRLPIVYNLKKKCLETLTENPYLPGEAVFPVAAFNSPGYVLSYLSAYQEKEDAKFLPLFSYGAAGWHHGKFRTAAILVDSEPRQDLRQMKHKDILAGVRRMRKLMPDNQLRQHLEKCALEYSCPAGKNFFLARYEAPLPTSQQCNARCLGCLSLQKNPEIPSTQQRIAFTPSPHDIAQVALTHIGKVKQSVVSFGQGCEGDPLLAADVILPAIRLIRAETTQGTINMNTNGSKPDILE
ncbi:MAG TPA: radical SAM protein, partial [Desulfobacteraceae bacterium]|nr:radical SAM protein [Desulfobacteraceae bacterium]